MCKFYCTILSTLSLSFLYSQSLHLENLQLPYNSNSKVIYLGLENLFRVKGIAAVQKINAEHANVTCYANTLKISPTRSGVLKVLIHTTTGEEEVQFQVTRLPAISVTIDGHSTRVVNKSDVIAFGSLALLPAKNDIGNYLQPYLIKSWQVKMDGNTFHMKGAKFPEQLKAAIVEAQPGTAITIGNIILHNPANNRQLVIEQDNFLTVKLSQLNL